MRRLKMLFIGTASGHGIAGRHLPRVPTYLPTGNVGERPVDLCLRDVSFRLSTTIVIEIFPTRATYFALPPNRR